MRQTLDILVFGPRSAIFIPASRVTERIKYTMVFVMVQKDNDKSSKHNMPFVDSETGSGRFQCLPLHLHLHYSKRLISSHLERCEMIERDYSAVPPQRQASRPILLASISPRNQRERIKKAAIGSRSSLNSMTNQNQVRVPALSRKAKKYLYLARSSKLSTITSSRLLPRGII